MSEKNINEMNQNVESKVDLRKSPKYVAAVAGLSLMTQVQAQQIIDEVNTPVADENKTTLVVDQCEKNINTDVITIANSDWEPVAKTLERDEQPELTQYNLSDLNIVSNYQFEDKMYLFSDQTSLVSEDHPGNFVNMYDVSSFYTSNHVYVETPCEPNKDGKTVDRWEQKLIAFNNMSDVDKEIYFRLLNTIFQKAKINHSGWDLPENMSRSKLEKIITTLSSFAYRQLSIPNLNSDIKQPLEASNTTISKYNLNIMTELAYMENLLMGTQPKVIDRWDGVFYAFPEMSQEFMDFLSSQDTEGNSFISVEQINSMLAIADQLEKLSVVEAPEVIDYAQIKETYISFFLNEKLATRFWADFEALSSESQAMMLSTFSSAIEQLDPATTARNKHKFAISLLKIYQEVEKKSGAAERRVQSLIKWFPELQNTQFENTTTLIAQEADYTPGVDTDFTPEQKAQLAMLRQQIASDRQQIASDRQHIKEYDMLNWIAMKIKEDND